MVTLPSLWRHLVSTSGSRWVGRWACRGRRARGRGMRRAAARWTCSRRTSTHRRTSSLAAVAGEGSNTCSISSGVKRRQRAVHCSTQHNSSLATNTRYFLHFQIMPLKNSFWYSDVTMLGLLALNNRTKIQILLERRFKNNTREIFYNTPKVLK